MNNKQWTLKESIYLTVVLITLYLFAIHSRKIQFQKLKAKKYYEIGEKCGL